MRLRRRKDGRRGSEWAHFDRPNRHRAVDRSSSALAGLREDGEALVCSFCESSYPIRDGIPVLLMDDATPGPNGIGVAAHR